MKTLILCSLALVPQAFAQGGDDCSSALAISGEWSGLIDNRNNSTSGFVPERRARKP